MFAVIALLSFLQPEFTGRELISSPDSVSYNMVGNEMTISGSGEINERGVDTSLQAHSKVRTDLTSVIIEEGVTSIGGNSFHDCNSLEKVVVAKSITEIKDMAFNFCKNLNSINLPGVKSIGKYAFNKCDLKLEYVNFSPDLTFIGESAFSDCLALKKIYIPKSVSFIGVWGFVGCFNVEELVFEEGSKLVRISKACFCQLTKITELHLPDSINDLDEMAFYHCASLQSVHLGPNIIDMDKNVFSYCEQLKAFTVDPANPVYTAVDGVLFTKDKSLLIQYPCGVLGKYVLPNSVKIIGSLAFANAQLEEFDYESNSKLEEILGAFWYNPNLVKVRLPASTKKMSVGEFGESPKLCQFEYCSTVVNKDDNLFQDDKKMKIVSVSEAYPADKFGPLPVIRNATCKNSLLKNIPVSDENKAPKSTSIIISVSLLSVFVVIGIVIAIKVNKAHKIADINDETLLVTQKE